MLGPSGDGRSGVRVYKAGRSADRRIGSAQLGSVRIGSDRIRSPRIGLARIGSVRQNGGRDAVPERPNPAVPLRSLKICQNAFFF